MDKEKRGVLSLVCSRLNPSRIIARKKPLYYPLNHYRSEIRLLQVWRRPRDEPLTFRFMNIALDYHLPYCALSYVWGDPTITENIEVNDRTLAVTKNLASALRYIGENLNKLVPNVNFIWLWVDAICINQKDVAEKNFQVQLMRNIYNQAQLVISWLGVEIDGKALAVGRIKNMACQIRSAREAGAPSTYSWLENHAEYCDRELFKALEDELRSILDHEYWGRVWILQEVALAWHVAIMSGSEVIADQDVAVVLSWLHHIQALQPPKPPKVDSLVWHSLTDPLGFSFIDLQIHFRLGKYKNMANLGLHVLPDTVRLQATDPRDKVYGLQGLLPMGIVVDYAKEIKDVYIDAAKKWIEGDTVFPLLCRAGVGLQPKSKNPFNLPSWVPDWQSLSVGKAGNGYQNATFTTRALRSENTDKYICSRHRLTARNHLVLEGILFDTITSIESDFGGVNRDLNSVASFCAAFAQLDKDPQSKPYPTRIPRLQVAFRSILAGSFSSTQNSGINNLCNGFLIALAHLDLPFPTSDTVPEWTEARVERLSELTGLRVDSSFSESLQELVLGSGISCPKAWCGLPAIEVLAQGREYFGKSHWSVVRNCFNVAMCRRVFHTSRGYLGVGPPGICNGDIVVTLSGVHWPAVLRRQKDSCYQLVGLCCVVDIMNSNFWDTLKKGNDPSKIIELFELC